MSQWPLEQYQNDPEFFMYLTMGQFRAELARLMDEMPDITQKRLSEILGLSEPRISNILHSSPNITIKTMCALAGAFNKMLEVKLVDRIALGQAKVSTTSPVVYSPIDARGELATSAAIWKKTKVRPVVEVAFDEESSQSVNDGVNGEKKYSKAA